MSTFVLVHGAWHGAWCWDLLRPELVERGHRVVTMDLPCDDPSATFDTYADVECEAMDGHADQESVLVGHSLAGHTIPLVAARRAVARVVYLCALIPEPGLTFKDQNGDGDVVEPGSLAGLGAFDERGCRTGLDPELTRRAFLHDCPDSIAGLGVLTPSAAGVRSIRRNVCAGRTAIRRDDVGDLHRGSRRQRRMAAPNRPRTTTRCRRRRAAGQPLALPVAASGIGRRTARAGTRHPVIRGVFQRCAAGNTPQITAP